LQNIPKTQILANFVLILNFFYNISRMDNDKIKASSDGPIIISTTKVQEVSSTSPAKSNNLLNSFLTSTNHVYNSEKPPNFISALALSLLVSFGGFVFGYDVGTISGFLNLAGFLQQFGIAAADGTFFFPAWRSGLIVSIITIGGLLGGLISSKLADKYGRKRAILGFNAVYIISLIIQMTAHYWAQILIGRMISGIALGAFTVIVPMVISESVPTDFRGACVSSFQFMITLAILIGNAVCYGAKNLAGPRDYLIPLGLSFIFSAIIGISMFIFPESPRYLATVGKIDEAHRALAKTICVNPNSQYITTEMSKIIQSIEADKVEGSASWRELFTGKPKIFYRVMVGIVMLSLQQLSGVNYFFYYGNSLFKTLGSNDSFATAMILSGVNCVCTLIGMLIVNRFARRTLLIAGSIIMLVAFLFFSTFGSFFLYFNNNENVNSAIGMVMIVFAGFFIFGFATTWAPLAFVVISEIFPQRIRSKAIALATGAMWIWNFIIGFSSPMITNKIGYKYGYVFSGFILASVMFVYFGVHETKGVTLEEINDMYASGVSAIESAKHVKILQTKARNKTGQQV
jgi:SP family sugar:H+ symporter-like MFS transporter